jgi:hypothetical protein
LRRARRGTGSSSLSSHYKMIEKYQIPSGMDSLFPGRLAAPSMVRKPSFAIRGETPLGVRLEGICIFLIILYSDVSGRLPRPPASPPQISSPTFSQGYKGINWGLRCSNMV